MTRHINSLFQSVSYRVNDVMVDPGDEAIGFNAVNSVLLTHAHFDHIYGLNKLLRISPAAKVYTNEAGREMLLDAKRNMSYYHGTPFVFDFPDNISVVSDRDIIEVGEGKTVQSFYTPGHNGSCITWVMDDILFTGDSLIPGIRTVTNLPGGDRQLSTASEILIKQLAQHRTIYPGHPGKTY